ncbi:MAG: F0F1 ATP synthase subunit A [Muribaculaceae bacterium]|nr:F0F1 ATP synthase subunit A [Muribaculaceae bacterium]
MKLRLKSIMAFLLAAVLMAPVAMAGDRESGIEKDASEALHDVEKDADEAAHKLDPKDIIFEHLGDAYGWEVPFDHHHRIPLPVIVWVSDGLHVFSSSRVTDGQTYHDGDLSFRIAGHDSPYKGKVVEVTPDGKEIKPLFDFSITKNVCGIFISLIIVLALMFWLVGFYRRNGLKAPRKGLGAIEALMIFIYDTVIKSTLGKNASRFAPYLLSVFFFIFVMNLLGLIVIFPGGANLTGNIAVTLVLAVLTFLVTNLFGNRHYWKEIFWPDVPIWLKFPIPIMQFIEVFGIFTKPAALTVRLFANMMGGHMIVLVLTLLIFIFAAASPAAGGGATVISVLFSVFMLLIDVLVSFIQAYVFTMLSTIFISLANEEHAHEEHAHEHATDKATAEVKTA